MPRISFRYDLGLRNLSREWRSFFTREHLKADVVAGLTVACVAIPLSLAIALASGVAPATGLVTAIVAGIVCALFGGTRLAVSGPAAAMAVLIGTLVQQHGLGALLIVGVGCGLLQLLTGVFGLGRFVRLVPLPVIEGFTAGIGAIILIGQLPRALGLPPPAQSHVFDVVTHIADLLHRTNLASVLVTLGALGVIYGLPRITKRIPAHLAAVVLSTALVAGLGVSIGTIGDIPRSLPLPKIPEFPANLSLSALLGSTLVVYALASLETLLSSTAVDKLAGTRSDPDQELIGQGIGNTVVALFGGIPVTGVIARSSTNVLTGAKTRRSAIIHSITLIAAVLVFAPVIGRIPVATLAAVLFSVAFRMLDPRAFLRIWRHSRSDGAVFAVTFAVIVFVDLLEGVQWGVVAALVIAAIRLGRTKMTVRTARVAEHNAFVVNGPLTFLSSLEVEKLRVELDKLEEKRGVLIDVSDVSVMDASGAEMLASLVEHGLASGHRVVVIGLTDEQRAHFLSAGGPGLEEHIVASEREVSEKLGSDTSADVRLRAGVERYRKSFRPRYSQLFEQLAGGQAPHTLFIGCCDSRVQPNLLTSTEPGELFIVRDIGAVVPVHDGKGSSVGAAVEYAVAVLGVKKIVVCGHSGCGAIKAMLTNGAPKELTSLRGWLDSSNARAVIDSLPKSLGADEVTRLVVLAQLDNLRSYPVVRDAEERGELTLDPWFFDVGRGELEEWNAAMQRYVPVAPHVHVDAADHARHANDVDPHGPPSGKNAA